MFNTLSDRITGSFKNLRSKGRLSSADVEQTISEIRRALLDADVALPVVRSFTAAVREKATGALASQALNPGQQVVRIVNDELVEILGGESREINMATSGPTVIMLAGLQGAGKTTLAGKLGLWLRERGDKVLLVASDLQRPNAVQQLEVVGTRADVDVWAPEPGNGVGDPVQVARTGVEFGRENGYDVVVVDTAGRLGVDREMMHQAINIRDAVTPNEILFVVDSMIGQDAVATANAFKDGVGFTGVVLSKLDGDTRGGAALSVRGVTGRPILFASTGEKLEDFEQFHADRMASRILDMGDILTLIEQAERTWDEEQQAELASKMAEGDFTLSDFIDQLHQLKRMGSMKKIMGMLPGMGQYRDALEAFDESSVDRIEAIVNSMTPTERNDPKILNGSRRMRIAKGSGTTVQEINAFIDRFMQAKKMMQQMSRGGGVPGMPGMPGVAPAGGSRKSKRAQKKTSGNKKGRSGNPAKRARQEAEAAAKANLESQAQPKRGSAFGAGASPADPGQGMEDFDIKDLQRFLR